MSGMTAQELEDLVYFTLDSFRGPARFPTQARAGREDGFAVWNWTSIASFIAKLGLFDPENRDQDVFELTMLPLPREVRWLKTACSRAAFFKAALGRKTSWEDVTIC
jgi:hypothetical protein